MYKLCVGAVLLTRAADLGWACSWLCDQIPGLQEAGCCRLASHGTTGLCSIRSLVFQVASLDLFLQLRQSSKKDRASTKVAWDLVLELAHGHFHCLLLVKKSHWTSTFQGERNGLNGRSYKVVLQKLRQTTGALGLFLQWNTIINVSVSIPLSFYFEKFQRYSETKRRVNLPLDSRLTFYCFYYFNHVSIHPLSHFIDTFQIEAICTISPVSYVLPGYLLLGFNNCLKYH